MSSTPFLGKNFQPDPTLYNEDLAPVTKEKRNWTWINYSTLWMGMVHNIVSYETAGALLSLGMSVWQALATVAVAQIFLILAMWLNSVAGAKYGLPFPVLIRASFGHKGAHIPVLIRAFVAIFWFAVQTFAGGKAVGAILGLLIPGWKHLEAYSIIGMSLTDAISFVIFWILHAYVVSHGMERVKKFELWAGPLVIVLGFGLVAWAIVQADGVAPLFAHPSQLSGPAFWNTFFLSVTGIIGVFATLVLNIPDFTRFARSQRDQVIGQGIGLPITAMIFGVMSIIVTSGTIIAFGKPIWDPVALLLQFHNPVVLVLGAFSLLIATLSINIAANVVSPAYDLINLFPKRLNFVRAGIISMVIAVFFAPWLWFNNSEVIFMVLGIIGGSLGPIAGIMIADYFIVRRREYDLESFYRTNGTYAYVKGWNPRAYIALGLGMIAALIGLIIPALHTLYTYSWFIGVAVGALSYIVLMRSYMVPKADIAAPSIVVSKE